MKSKKALPCKTNREKYLASIRKDHEMMVPIMKAKLSQKVSDEQVLAERAKQYGDATLSHKNLGLEWTGILQNHFRIELPHPIPAHVVLLMMAASKMNRAATPTPGQPDDYADGRIYFSLAEQARGKR